MMQTTFQYALALATIVLTTAAAAHAGLNTVPEIDANVVSAGLGLLAAGALIVRSRRRSK